MPYTLEQAYKDLQQAWTEPSTAAIHEVIAISEVMHEARISDPDIAAWADAAAEGLLRLGLPPEYLFHPNDLDGPRSALIFVARDKDLSALPLDVSFPNLLEIRLGSAAIDWSLREASNWPRLRSIVVRRGPGTESGLFPWLSRQHFPALRRLVMGDCGLPPADFHALLRSEFWSSLENIVLSNNPLGPGDALWPSAAPVRTLTFDYVGADDQALRSLLQSSMFALEGLDVSGNQLTVAGLEALVAAPLPALQRLSARGNEFSDQPIWDTLAGSFWPNLVHLDISGDGHDPDVLLRASGLLASVPSLNLNSSKLGDAGVAALVSLPFTRLGILSIAYNKIGVDGARALARAELPDLEEVELSVSTFGDDGVRALTGAPWWPRIRRLSLINIGLTDAGVELIASRPPASVERIEVGTSNFDEASIARLQAALPAGATLR